MLDDDIERRMPIGVISVPESSPTVRRRRLGLILRELRTKAHLTCEEVGGQLERSGSWVSRIENGRTGLRARDLRDLLDIYRVEDAAIRTEMEQLARDSKQRGWWNRYGQTVTGPYASFISFEHEATSLLCYEGLVINGLLQTEDYARALHQHAVSNQAGDDAERHISVKLRRQERLTAGDPPNLWVILDESVLCRPFGGSRVMRNQLTHLLDVTHDLPHVSIQILPFQQTIFPGMTASFVTMEFPPPDAPLAFSESPTGAIHEEEDDAKSYSVVFDELRAAALSKTDSTKLIQSTLDVLA